MVARPTPAGPGESELDALFHALSDATRRDILRRTLTEAPSVTALASAYDMSFAAVQKHVAVLEAAGLVAKTTAGRARLVRAVPDQLARATAALRALEALWQDRLSRLEDLLNSPEEPSDPCPSPSALTPPSSR